MSDSISARPKLVEARDAGLEVRVIFNHGRAYIPTTILLLDEEYLTLLVSSRISSAAVHRIGLSAQALFSFEADGSRFQFLSKTAELEDAPEGVVILTRVPAELAVIPLRRERRIDAKGLATLHAPVLPDVVFEVREVSSGGLSIWSDDAHGLAPGSLLEACRLAVGEATALFDIEIVRISYALDDPRGKTHAIAAKIIHRPDDDSLLALEGILDAAEDSEPHP